jgi:uncharacterized membrane protein YphA (DoxX/SURF4 family)
MSNPRFNVMRTKASGRVVLVRLAVGLVFISEGLQKFLFSEELGAGRFAKIGIPWPGVTAPFVGAIEFIAGVLVLVGLYTRLAALLLVIDMVVAFTSTKVPILIGHGFSVFANPPAGKAGFWAMAHEARTDVAMFFGSLLLLWVGAGALSIDAGVTRRREGRGPSR